MRHQFEKNRQSGDDVYILLDMDGVVSDFDRHARDHGKYRDNGAVNWNALDEQWWASMPPTPGAREFFDAVSRLAAVRFLSAPTLSEDAYSGKAKWVQSFLPELGIGALKKLILCPAADKRLLAGPCRILVDDRIKNVEEWRAAGGIGIHHTGDFSETMNRVRDALQRLRGANPRPGRGPSPGV